MHDIANIQVVITAAIKKQPVDQRALVDHYSDYLYAIAIRYMGNREEAKDVLQLSWIKAFQNLQKFDLTKGSFKSWIAKIVINTCLSEHRKNKVNLVAIHQDHYNIILNTESAIDKMASEEILEIVSQLPDHYRQVFNMASIDGYSHKEISDLLGITELVSRTRLKRAKEYLRKTFSNLINYTSWEKTI